MLVLTRKRGERLIIGDGDGRVVVTFLDNVGGAVRLGIDADRSIAVNRAEVHDRIAAERRGPGRGPAVNGNNPADLDALTAAVDKLTADHAALFALVKDNANRNRDRVTELLAENARVRARLAALEPRIEILARRRGARLDEMPCLLRWLAFRVRRLEAGRELLELVTARGSN